MTFKDLYNIELGKPSPAKVFIDHVAALTCRKPSTVRMWLSGKQQPNECAMKCIADELKLPVEELFPNGDASSVTPIDQTP